MTREESAIKAMAGYIDGNVHYSEMLMVLACSGVELPPGSLRNEAAQMKKGIDEKGIDEGSIFDSNGVVCCGDRPITTYSTNTET